MKKSLAALAAAASLVLVLTGCGADTGSSGSTKVTIGVVPGADLAPLFLGVKQGFFADEGINLTINSLASSNSGVVKGVVGGSFDLGYSDIMTLLSAIEGGSELSIVSGAAASSGVPALDYAAIIVPADSPITSIDQLSGHSLGIDEVRTTNDLVTRSLVDAAGGSSSGIELKQIPLINATAALKDKTVDAAFVVEPFATAARLEGMRVIAYPYAAYDPKLTVSAYFASTTFATEHPELVEGFIAAIEKSFDYALEEPNEVRTNIVTYIDSKADVRTRMALPLFTTTIDRPSIELLVSSAEKYGFLRETPDLDSLLP